MQCQMVGYREYKANGCYWVMTNPKDSPTEGQQLTNMENTEVTQLLRAQWYGGLHFH